uniref:Late expression factor 5 n=1 Tax=Spilarctia obliqua nucleopolyhedrovirus TaxID=1638618 RepID=A0A7G9U8G8_9ABAC|nr:late expression factor 5 [Spilarctia obliqua nucleopolyhedrovirus]
MRRFTSARCCEGQAAQVSSPAATNLPPSSAKRAPATKWSPLSNIVNCAKCEPNSDVCDTRHGEKRTVGGWRTRCVGKCAACRGGVCTRSFYGGACKCH